MMLEMKDRQRIMVIDNNQDMLRLLDRSLELEGFDTIIAVDEDEAVELMKIIKPDLVIMDAPVMAKSGLHTLDTVRHQTDVPIVIITSDSEMEALKKAFEHGADDYLRKPFNTHVLIARIRAKLRRSGRQYRP